MRRSRRSRDVEALAAGVLLLVAWALIGLIIAGLRGEQEPFDPVATFGVPGLALVAYVVTGLLAPSRPFRTGLLLGLMQVGLWWLQWSIRASAAPVVTPHRRDQLGRRRSRGSGVPQVSFGIPWR
jgi:hypothetical protein